MPMCVKVLSKKKKKCQTGDLAPSWKKKRRSPILRSLPLPTSPARGLPRRKPSPPCTPRSPGSRRHPPPSSCQPAPAARRVTRDEQARRQRWRRHGGPDGGGCGRRGAEAAGAPPEGRRRRGQPRRQLLRPHQHRPRQRPARAQLAGGIPDGHARLPHGAFSGLSVETSVGT